MSAIIFKEPGIESEGTIVIDCNVASDVSSDAGDGGEDSLGKIKACNIPVIIASTLYRELLSIAKMTIKRQDRTHMERCGRTDQYPLMEMLQGLLLR